MRAEIISIGTELLLGHIVNTDAAFLSCRLAETGIDVHHVTAVGDNPAKIAEAVRHALGRADIIITTGGLGPTVDDVTLKGAWPLLVKLFRKRGQAPFKSIHNKFGTAPGLIFEIEDKAIICLPGPPRELEPMFDNNILPYLKKKFGLKEIIISRVIKLTGLAEIKVNAKVKDLLKLKPPLTVGIYAKLGEVDLKIMAKAAGAKAAAGMIAPVEKKICSRLGKYIFGCDSQTLEGAVGEALIKLKKTIAAAESCTGGLIAHRLTNVAGSSAYFKAGVIAYSNKTKEHLLGVSGLSLQKYGAVSKHVALEMARGVRLLARTDIGVGVTGIAGPTGGTKSKPVGLVYAAIVTGKRQIVRELRFRGSREEIKFQASQAVLDAIRKIA